MIYIAGFIVAIIILVAIYNWIVDSISSALLPLATFFNIDVWTLFWILIISLAVLIIVIIGIILNKKFKRDDEASARYENQLRQREDEIRRNTRYCPECQEKLILKDGIHGLFWGCASYPDCLYTEQVSAPPKPIQVAYVEPEFTYELKTFLTQQEKEFLVKLQNVIKNFYDVKSQVAYSTLFKKIPLNIDEVTNKNDKRIIFSFELSYVADFVLYDKITELPFATIEFNGIKHYEKAGIEKDTKKRTV